MKWGALSSAAAAMSLCWAIVATSVAPGQSALANTQTGDDAPAEKSASSPEGSGSDIKTEPSQSVIKKFDHDAHAHLDAAEGRAPLDMNDCGQCHGKDARGTLARIAARGHQPCLAAGCHAQDYLSVGPQTRKVHPDRYKKAAAFCAGCHAETDSVAPSPFVKNKADNLYLNNPNPQHHVEMNHLAHSQEAACRQCHVVDPNTQELVKGRPGHEECASCHNDEVPSGKQSREHKKHGGGDELFPMGQCKRCHTEPAAAKYFKPRVFESDVRSCKSDRHAELSEKRGARVPCFAHERQGHRVRDNGDLVQCVDCHFMFESKSYQGHDYVSLLDVKQAPMMDNAGDRAHRRCGASGCHASAVDDSKGRGRCNMCHSSRSIVDSLFGGGSSRAPKSKDSASSSDDTDTTSAHDAAQGDRDKHRGKDSSAGDLFDSGSSDAKRKRKRNKPRKKKRGGSSLFD